MDPRCIGNLDTAQPEGKLQQLAGTSDDAWESMKESVKSTWELWNLPCVDTA